MTARFIELTGIEKATKVAQLKKWLSEEKDVEMESMNKEAVKDLLAVTDDAVIEEVMRLRQELSKSSVSKYRAMARSVCADGRVRGLLLFYGANRTGRWAGRVVQCQNLTKTELSETDQILARQLVKERNVAVVEVLYGEPQQLLSGLVRSAFVAPTGKRYVVIDFSAIEARVVAWLAGCMWRMEVFNTHGKIYEASAEQMFKLPPGSVDKKSPYRQKGKIAELALGYMGGKGALITMGALKMGIPESELQPIVDAWRAANPEIVDFARGMEKHAKECLRTKLPCGVPGKYLFKYESGMLFMELPSGRSLCYVKPRIVEEDGFRNITYDGVDQDTKQWGRIKTYAGKLLENLTQAIARDCLAYVLPDLEADVGDIVMHVHDEAVAEVAESEAEAGLHKAEEILSREIPWAPGLPLKGDGFTASFYQK